MFTKRYEKLKENRLRQVCGMFSIPVGNTRNLPRGLRLLLGEKKDFQYTVEYLESCCDTYPNCEYKTQCRKLYDSCCKNWWEGEAIPLSPTVPTRKQPAMVEVVIPRGGI